MTKTYFPKIHCPGSSRIVAPSLTHTLGRQVAPVFGGRAQRPGTQIHLPAEKCQ
jgi:hypothetical protein